MIKPTTTSPGRSNVYQDSVFNGATLMWEAETSEFYLLHSEFVSIRGW